MTDAAELIVRQAAQGRDFLPAEWLRAYCPSDESMAVHVLKAQDMGIRLKGKLTEDEWRAINHEKVRRWQMQRPLADKI